MSGLARMAGEELPRGKPAEPTMSCRQRRKALWRSKILQKSSFKISPSSSSVNNFGRLPPEVLLKIMAFLDASSLYSIGYVNKQLHALANSNALWYRLYVRESAERKLKAKLMDEMADELTSVAIQEKPRGHWKRLLFKKMAGFNKDKWLNQLKVINPYTGLPRQTEHVLRSVGVSWEMTVIDKRRLQHTYKPSRAFFSESSLSLTWHNLADLSRFDIVLLQFHGLVPMPLDRGLASCSPEWRSLIAEVDMKKQNWQYFGSCLLVRMRRSHQFPGITMGLWRDSFKKEKNNNDIVFVKMTLHFHKLVERSLLGSITCPYTVPEHQPMFDDIDPEYGLHGYKVHVELHDMAKPIMSGQFTGLFCRRENIRGEYVVLPAISRSMKSEHTAFTDKLCLKWRSEGLEGSVENCCVLNMTVLDESDSPVWCVSSAVTVGRVEEPGLYDYRGEPYTIQHKDPGGKIYLDLIWMEELGQYFLVRFNVCLPVAKINRLYRRDY